ncbi:STAS/SEC14 domain-containing protein [Aliifodinibius sp. S!AR15-10]|uniref:STAS/SEC14 domain-containing protein n=1 Tax=Aliifodinibius sp. S!AR15-10 TaxID=2950437 RepID=UPI0028554656|nr:STAS/SEC14 domain-containing protein [Aliifodinibius sp. S!AR15-10]MDR8389972.1 STAS/SEC14 domain-containing protein [Aliifodinibius sp. S!AR15-10]
MIAIDEKSSEVLEVNLSEIFSRGDIDQLAPTLKKYARNSVKPRLLLTATDFQGWYGAGPWWSDLKLDDECDCNVGFQRIALIGDRIWKVWLTTLISSFTSSEIKFFTPENIAEARKWLNSIIILSNRTKKINVILIR